MATINWDIVDGAYASETGDGWEICRPVGVEGLVGDATQVGKNPAVLMEALSAPGMPIRGDQHPTRNDALLEERRARSIGSVSACIVDLIYRARGISLDLGHGSASTWSITDAYVTSSLITYATADGSMNAELWYKADVAGGSLANGDITQPAGARLRVSGVHKITPRRVITVSGRLKKSDWDGWKPTVRAAVGRINSDTWGTHTRGTWLFMGPRTRFFDKNNNANSIVYIDLQFMNDPDGHFPMLGYVDPQGIHPWNCSTEAELRIKGGFPPVGKVTHRNGKSLVSVYLETNFTPLFAFTPDT